MSRLNADAGFETILFPLMAVGAGLLTFAFFCEWVGVSAVGVFASIYKAGFGSWYSWQNSLVRAAPLMLCGLATALPARAGIITVGNEGAFVIGGLAATAAGLATTSAPPLVCLSAMALAGMAGGGAWIAQGVSLK